MTQQYTDQWAHWLQQGRFGGDSKEQVQAKMGVLIPVRDRIVQNAGIHKGDVLLDVGCGEGLIAFGALDAVGKQGKIILSDISADLLRLCRTIAERMRVLGQCEFLLASAEDLRALENDTVNIVTARSVLIYVKDKRSAFREFHRLLKPGGRVSLFEPINSFGYSASSRLFWGYDITGIQPIASKVQGIFDRIQPPGIDPMMNFDERVLLGFAEEAGFAEIHLELRNDVIQRKPNLHWESFLATKANPLVPTIKDAIDQALTPDEADEFERFLRPLVETGRGMHRAAWAYLWAVK